MKILKKKIRKTELARLVLGFNPDLNKTLLARYLSVSRDCLYEVLKLPCRDEVFKNELVELMKQEPYYGHRRLAYQLNCNPKKTLRLMRKYELRCRFRRPRFKYTKNQSTDTITNTAITNVLQDQKPNRPNQYWSGDFTYIPYKSKFIYLAIQKDLFTREAVGYDIQFKHTGELISNTIKSALQQNKHPELSHSDQGSEYHSNNYQNLLKQANIICSMSTKASPWENGYSEGFFSTFKLEFGNANRYENEAELISAIYRWIRYYNNQRIHTALKMSPVRFKQKWIKENRNKLCDIQDRV